MDKELEKIILELQRKVAKLEADRTPKLHAHTGFDSNKVSGYNLKEVLPIGDIGVGLDAKNARTAGNGQTFGGGFGSLPIPIIRGFGVGGSSAFVGGDAPDGTMLLFTNGLTLSGLQIRSDGEWYTIAIDSIA